MRAAFITNFCPHYRLRVFEALARSLPVDYYFFSAGTEWYWDRQIEVQSGDFSYRYLSGFNVGKTRITLSLPWLLWRGNYDVYIKCINGRFALPVSYLVAKLRRKPFILWTEVWMRIRTPVHRLLFPLTSHIYRHADAVVAGGEHVRRYLLSEGVLNERIFVAPNAVDNDAYGRAVSEDEKSAVLEALGIGPNQRIVLYMGRLEEEKGLTYLLEAFAKLRADNVMLLIAGDGSLRSALESSVREKNLRERVRFAGHTKPDQLLALYSLAYVLVLPSVTTPTLKEAWGMVVNEALNQGVPVVASDAVGAAAAGLVTDGFNGLIVPERNSGVLAGSLQSLLDKPDLRAQMSKNARDSVAMWDTERMVLGFRSAIDYVRQDRKRIEHARDNPESPRGVHG